jgi:tetratricopeptide (TPR) repeat protein
MKVQLFKKIKRKLARHVRLYSVIGLFVAVFCVGAWFAASFVEDEPKEVDFGDAFISKNARSISKASYEDALALIDEGKLDEGLEIMKRLAPLGVVEGKPKGNAKAHLWMAQRDIGSAGASFLEKFPLGYSQTQPLEPGKIYRHEQEVEKAMRHLEIAVTLAPELKDAYLLLASMQIVQSKRDEALITLMSGISHKDGVHDSLLIALANTTTYEGDKLALKEWSWLGFSTLGHEVAGRRGGSLSKWLNYAAYALLLGKDEVVDLAVKRIERDFSEGGNAEAAHRVVKSLKMAKFYFKSISQLDAAHTSGDYTKVAQALVNALIIQSENETLIQAVKSLAQEKPVLRPKMKQWLDEAGVESVVAAGERSSHFYLLMSDLSSEKTKKKKYLEQAFTVAPHDPDVLLESVLVRLSDENPAYGELEGMLKEVEQGTNQGFPRLAELYWAQGLVLFHQNKIQESIGRLERALVLSDDKAKIHELLSQAYQKAGHQKLAKVHATLSSER